MKHDMRLSLLCHLGVIFSTFRVSLGQSCTFQSGLCDWINVGSGPRWRSSRDPNTSSSSSAEELKSYAYVTISQNTDNSTAAILQSPEVNAATTDIIEIGFQYQLSDHLANALSVRWSRNGDDFNNVWHTNGPTNSWVTTSLLLAQGSVSRFAVQFLGQSTVPSQDAFVMIRNAEIRIKHDSCASSPCFHGGLCFGNGQTFTCICTGGYRGEVCQILPGAPLSRLFRGRSSYRGVTTAHLGNMEHITSTPTIKSTPQFIDTSTDLPKTRGVSTTMTTTRLATDPTHAESTTESSPSPCMRRSTVPAVPAATTEVSGVTDKVTSVGTSDTMNTDSRMTSGSELTTQSETRQSTEQTSSTLPRSTIESLTSVTSAIPELTTDSLSMTTATPLMPFPTTSPTTMTTYFDDLSTAATDVVSGISSTDEPSATLTLTSIQTGVPSSNEYSTISDVSTISFKSTESIQTTHKTTPISSTTDWTTVEVSQRVETTQFTTQSRDTTDEIGTVTGAVSSSTHDIVTYAVTELSTKESTTRTDTPPSTNPMTSKTNDLVTQSSTTRVGDEITNSEYLSTTGAKNGIVTTETATSSVSTEERITDLETSGYSISTGMVTSATTMTTEKYEFDTSPTSATGVTILSTKSTNFKPSSTDESSETPHESTVGMVTEGSRTDIPTTGIGVASTSSPSSSMPVSSSPPLSNSSTTALKVSSYASHSTLATTLYSNITKTTDKNTSSITDVMSSSQSPLNSTSASVSGSGGAVNVPLAVGLSVTGVVCTVVGGVTIFIVRRARRVSYGLTES